MVTVHQLATAVLAGTAQGVQTNPNTTTNGGECQPGYYCPAGSSDPQPCPGGWYCQFAQLDTPTSLCSPGYYCLERSSTATPADGSTGDICPAGFYCGEGVAWPTPCEPGTYSPSTGNRNETDCIQCDLGEYCGEYNLTATSGDLLFSPHFFFQSIFALLPSFLPSFLPSSFTRLYH